MVGLNETTGTATAAAVTAARTAAGHDEEPDLGLPRERECIRADVGEGVDGVLRVAGESHLTAFAVVGG